MANEYRRDIAARDVREDRGSDTRDENRNDRSRGRGKGALVDYYEDLGFSTTKDAYAAWQANEKNFQSEKAKAQSQLSEASITIGQEEEKYRGYLGQIDEAMGELGTVSSNVTKAWDTFQSGFAKVQIHNANGLAYTKSVPKEKVNDLLKDLPSTWEKSYNSKTKTFVVKPLRPTQSQQPSQQGPAVYGDRGSQRDFSVNGNARQDTFNAAAVNNKAKFVADSFDRGLEDLKNKFYEKNTPLVEKNFAETKASLIASNKNIQSALNQIAVKKGEIKAANYTIAQTEAMRQEQIQNLRTRYEKRVEALSNFFNRGGVKVLQNPQETTNEATNE